MSRVSLQDGIQQESFEGLLPSNSDHNYFLSHPETHFTSTSKHIEVPIHDSASAPDHLFHDNSYTSPPLVFSALSDATLVRRAGIVINKKGQLIRETLEAQLWHDPNLERTPDITINDKALLSEIGNTSFTRCAIPTLHTNHGGYNVYGHFLFETMCSAFFMRDFLKKGALKLILPFGASPWQFQMLEAIGISTNSILRSGYRNIKFNQLVLSSSCSGKQTFKPGHALKEMVSHLKSNVDLRDDSPLLYVTRSGAKTTSQRVLLNEQELCDDLKQFGFRCVEPTKLNFLEQIRLFSNAKIVIALHGSALANSIFMPAGSILVDLQPTTLSEDSKNWTKNISTLFSLRFFSISCNSYSKNGTLFCHANTATIKDTVSQLLAST